MFENSKMQLQLTKVNVFIFERTETNVTTIFSGKIFVIFLNIHS